jgi:hypothetical protein
MKLKLLLVSLILAACVKIEPNKSTNDLIEKGIISYTKKLDSGMIRKTLYINQETEDKEYMVGNWSKEFELFSSLNFNRISKQGDLVFDTTLDQRTNRYLIRGMRLTAGMGFQNLFIMLDSNRSLLQLKGAELKKTFFSESQIEYFWSTKGEYHYRKLEHNKLSPDSKIEIIAEW